MTSKPSEKASVGVSNFDPQVPDSPTAKGPEKGSQAELLGFDVEKSDSTIEKNPDISAIEIDPLVVNFDGPNDPENPRNWSRNYKWLLVAMLSSMETMVNLGTLMCTPAIGLIQRDFGANANSKVYSILLVSIWELGEAFGPLLVAPLSEYFGRYPVYHTANIMFVVFCVTSAVSQNTAMLVVSRFLNGLSVASITLNAAIVGDLFVTEEQGTAQALMGLAPLIGPVLGPTIGGYIAQSIGWRWMFGILAIASGVVELTFLLVFRETYAMTILRRKTKRLIIETGNPLLKPALDRPYGIKKFFTQAIIRPARMLILSPVILVLAIYVSLIFAYLYILFTNITQIFESRYGFSTGNSGLVYIGLGVGMTAGMFLCRATLDKYVRRMESRNAMKPEQRLVPMVVGSLGMPIGLLWYGWTVEARVHWIAPVIGLAFCGFSVAVTIIPSFSYLVHAFGIHAASAIAATITLRCVVGVVLPLAAPALYGRLGLGWGNSLLALIALAFLPVPLVLLKKGEQFRSRSRLQVVHS